MKRLLCGAALALALAVWVLPAAAMSHEEPEPDPDKTINVSGEIRARWEYTANTEDADDDADADGFDFFPYRARVAVDGVFTENIFGKVEVQGFGWFGESDPFNGSGTTPVGQASQGVDDADADLYQAFLHLANIGDSNWHLRLGRQEYTLGNELHFGDADFYNGTSFDGVRGMLDAESWDLDLFYFIVDEDSLAAPDFNDQRETWGATVDFGIGEGDQHIEPYVIYVRDTGTADRVRAWMFGALWGNPVNEENAWDWAVEAAMQSGEVGPSGAETDLGGFIAEGWLGYTFSEAHRVHVGALMATGDDDGTDTDFDGFVPLFPDEHAHNRLGDLDLFGGGTTVATFDPSTQSPLSGGISNVMDINGGYTWSGENKQFRAALHMLTLAEEFDADGLGPLGGQDDIGNEIDLAYDYDYSRNLGFQVGYAHLLPGDLLDDNFNGADDADDVMRAWWQLRLRWN